MMGYSTQYAAGVWVGYHTRQKEMTGFMENMTSPIWKGWMNSVHDGLKPEERVKPAGIQTTTAYVQRTSPGGSARVPGPGQDLFPSWYKNTRKASNVKRVMDQVSNKLATDCTPPRARKETSDAGADAFSSDTFMGAGGSNPSEAGDKDDVHKCEDIKPSITLTVQPSGDSYNLIATVAQGTHPLSSDKFKGNVTFSINGNALPGGSYEISSSGSVVYQNYKPTEGVTVTATVVDSVLYDATDTETIAAAPVSLMNSSNPGNNNRRNRSREDD